MPTLYVPPSLSPIENIGLEIKGSEVVSKCGTAWYRRTVLHPCWASGCRGRNLTGDGSSIRPAQPPGLSAGEGRRTARGLAVLHKPWMTSQTARTHCTSTCLLATSLGLPCEAPTTQLMSHARFGSLEMSFEFKLESERLEGSIRPPACFHHQRSVNFERSQLALALQQPYQCLHFSMVVHRRESDLGLQLLLKWNQEQVQGARNALAATAMALRALRRNAEKLRQVGIFSLFLPHQISC